MTLNTSRELSVVMRIEASDYWGTQIGGQHYGERRDGTTRSALRAENGRKGH